jgi:uncharacterized protein
MDKNVNLTIKEYIHLIKKNFKEIECVYLFGSYAKGLETDNSDIDLALIFKDLDDAEKFNIQIQLMLLAVKIDTRIEPHPMSQEDFNSENPFSVEIKKTGILIAA